MLPMTVLRRFDCVLASSKAKVLAEHARLKGDDGGSHRQGQGRSLGPAAEQGRQPACRHRSSAIDTVLAYLSPGSFEAVPGPARVQSASPFPLKTAPGAYAVCSKMAQRGIEE